MTSDFRSSMTAINSSPPVVELHRRSHPSWPSVTSSTLSERFVLSRSCRMSRSTSGLVFNNQNSGRFLHDRTPWRKASLTGKVETTIELSPVISHYHLRRTKAVGRLGSHISHGSHLRTPFPRDPRAFSPTISPGGQCDLVLAELDRAGPAGRMDRPIAVGRLRDLDPDRTAQPQAPLARRLRPETRAGHRAARALWRTNQLDPAKPVAKYQARSADPHRKGAGNSFTYGRAGPWRKNQLVIPHGLAFGSGEHATTFMLLRALASIPVPARVLDLGTGSGVLALAARRFRRNDDRGDRLRSRRGADGAGKRGRSISPRRRIRWRRADVKKLSGKARYDLILANLFSGILVEAARRNFRRRWRPSGSCG